jgi:hypothetical protein
MTGVHRGGTAPWWVRATCWLYGHATEPAGDHVHCRRCDRNARTPVELP